LLGLATGLTAVLRRRRPEAVLPERSPQAAGQDR
jgi:hypothetical protein